MSIQLEDKIEDHEKRITKIEIDDARLDVAPLAGA